MTTLDQVEKLRSMANVSYDEAKVALDASNGDLLEAIIYLEKLGKVNTPAGGGYYSSEKAADSGDEGYKKTTWEKQVNDFDKGNGFISFMNKLGKIFIKMFHKGNINHFEVLKGQESKASVPVTVLALLLIFAFYVTLPLMIIGLFFGYRYRFNGPEFAGNTVNDAMNSAADVAEDLKKSININK